MKMKRTYIDLFAGCGGLSLGFHNSQEWRGIFAVEKSPDAFETLKHNLVDNNHHFDWPEWLPCRNHDINKLLTTYRDKLHELRGSVDLVAGGPPCQGFSSAGRRIENDDRNQLVHSYIELIKIVRPKIIFFENVKGFRIGFNKPDFTRGEPYSEIVLKKLNMLGYKDARAELINFAEFGIPQERTRCIIVGTLEGRADQFFEFLQLGIANFLEDRGIQARQTVKKAISDIERSNGEISSPDSNGFQAGVYSQMPLSSYQELMRQNSAEIPDSHRFVNHSKKTEFKLCTIISNKLNSREVREQFNTRKSSTKLLDPDLPTPTLTTLPDDYVHYSEPRILTVREYARIQSFPDWYEIKGKYTTGGPKRTLEVPRYSQIGNAIPPLFAEQAGMALSKIA